MVIADPRVAAGTKPVLAGKPAVPVTVRGGNPQLRREAEEQGRRRPPEARACARGTTPGPGFVTSDQWKNASRGLGSPNNERRY
jgi:hypothetical protein